VAVVLDHAVGIDAETGLALRLGLEVRPDVHARGVPPHEERLAVLVRLIDEPEGPGRDLLVDRLHALLGERAGVLDPPVRKAVDDAAGAEPLLEVGVLRIVRVLRLLLGIQVVEVAEELVEAVRARKVLVEVAEVVLAELTRRISLGLQVGRDGHVLLLQAEGRTGQAHLGEARADRRLPGEERGAPGGAALLPVPVGEQGAFPGDAVDVGRLVAHHAEVVGTDVVPADIVTPDDQDVRLLLLRPCRGGLRRGRDRGQHPDGGHQGHQPDESMLLH
jgi:hypothetical protein